MAGDCSDRLPLPVDQAIVQAIVQHTPNTGLTRFVRKIQKVDKRGGD